MVIGLDSANRAIQSFRISIVLIVSQFKSVYSSCRVKVLSSAGDTKRSSRSPLVAIRRATISGRASCWPAVVRSPQCFPCSRLHRMPRRALPPGPGRARGRVLHPGRVERGPPASLVVLSQLLVVALAVHAHGDVANPGP